MRSPNNRSINKGLQTYEMWNQREADDLVRVLVDLPTTVYQMGRAKLIAYRSSKWKESYTTTEDYEHDHGSMPFVYSEIGEGRAKLVAGLMKNKVIVDMGFCIEFIYQDLDGEDCELVIKKSRLPRLVCTTDKKTYIIMDGRKQIFVTGSEMTIEARGIIK